MIYHKLVRDKIPAIIEAAGKTCHTRRLDDIGYQQALEAKMLEEWDEYRRATTPEDVLGELADVLEVLHAIAEVHGQTFEAVERQRILKALERGTFEDRIFLIDVDD